MSTNDPVDAVAETGMTKEPGSGPAHTDKTRPADAGHVWGSSAAASGGVPGGVVRATANDEGKMEALSASEIKDNAAALQSDAEQVPVSVSSPEPEPEVDPETKAVKRSSR
jgi:hypothetical protein